MGGNGSDRIETTRGPTREVVSLLREVYRTDPRTTLLGGGVVAFGALAGVGYAVSVSLPGTVLAALAWLALAGFLAWKGWSTSTALRAALGAALYVLAIQTVVRLVSTTPPVASSRVDMGRLLVFASVVILLLLAGFTVWAIRTSGPASRGAYSSRE